MNKVFVTAEIGINASANMDTAKKLIDMAKLCGADAVKFQKRTVEKVYTKEFLDSPRQSPWGTTQREQKMALEFNKEQYDEIDRYSKQIGIPWYASAWDTESQEFLRQYDLPYNKIASPMALNDDVVEMVVREGKQTFISTGKVNRMQLDKVVSRFRYHNTPFTLMHCNNKYPCPDDECHVGYIRELATLYRCPVGFSSHNPSILPCSLAVAMGAEAIEVHITLDRSMYGTDQPASLEWGSLAYVCRDVSRVRSIIG